MCLLRRDLSRCDAGRWSVGGNPAATLENTLDDGGHRFGRRGILVDLFADHPSGFGIPIVRARALL